MNKETYESLKELVIYAHKELNKIKRVSNKYHMLVVLASIEGWMMEVEKEYQK